MDSQTCTYSQQPPPTPTYMYTLQRGLLRASEWHTHWRPRWIELVVTIQHKNNQYQHKVAGTTENFILSQWHKLHFKLTLSISFCNQWMAFCHCLIKLSSSKICCSCAHLYQKNVTNRTISAHWLSSIWSSKWFSVTIHLMNSSNLQIWPFLVTCYRLVW